MKLRVVDAYYRVEEDGYRQKMPVLHVFGRGTDYQRYHIKIDQFRPYFCVRESEWIEKGQKVAQDDRVLDVKTEDRRGRPETAIDGEPLYRIVCREPGDVGDLRDLFDDPFEADVLFPVRFLVDMDIFQWIDVPTEAVESVNDGPDATVSAEDISIGAEHPPETKPPVRLCTYDIEVEQGGSGPPVVSKEGTEQARNPITAITAHDSYIDEYTVWLLAHSQWNAEDSKAAREAVDANVSVYSNPRDVAGFFCEYVEERDFDALCGWNACVSFDASIQMADGDEKKMEDIERGDKIVGVENSEPSVGKVTEKVGVVKEEVEMEMESGHTVSFSEEHKIMVGDEDGVTWKRLSDIECGDYVLHPHKLPVESTEVPTFSELIPLERQRYHEEDIAEIRSRVEYGGMSDVADELGVATGTVYHNHPGVWRPDKVEDIADEYGLRPLPTEKFYQRNGDGLDEELSVEDMYLAGLVMSDGSMEYRGTINFYNNREELHNQFPSENTLYQGKDEFECLSQKVLDASYAWVFNGIGIPFGKKNGSFDGLEVIYRMPKEHIGAFMGGVIDGDGWVDSTVNIAVADGCARDWLGKLFRRLGVCCSINKDSISAKLSERSYRSLVEYVFPHLSHSGKARAVDELEPSTEASTEAVPKCLVEFGDIDKSSRYAYRNGYNLTRESCDVGKWGGWYFDKVESIDNTGNEVQMYDIETTVESFVASDILVHNSGFDHPYFVNWCLRNGVSGIYDLSPTGDVYDMDGEGSWINSSLKGRLLVDLLTMYKKTEIHELSSYRLEDVAAAEDVSVGKLSIEDEIDVPDNEPAIDYAWREHPDVFTKYSLRDVQAAVGINRESKEEVNIL